VSHAFRYIVLLSKHFGLAGIGQRDLERRTAPSMGLASEGVARPSS